MASVDQAVAQRCLVLDADHHTLKANMSFHWWPKPNKPI
jgi:hypothetical protein